MIDVKKLLLEIIDDERVLEDDIDLYESGLMDSYAFIELFSRLEDYGVIIQPTRIDRKKLRTVKGIEELVESYIKKQNS